MSEDNDIEMIAAEYALGCLDGEERAAVAARRLLDPALNTSIEQWERRLAPLNATIAPVEPPAHLFARVMARIGETAQDDRASNVILLQRRLRNWRMAAVGAGALAACLMIALGLRETAGPSGPRNFVAVMQKDAVSPAFIVSVDLDTRALTIRAVAAGAQPGKSYQLWLVDQSLGAPKSLGLLRPEGVTSGPRLTAYEPAVIENATYAVSLEPENGSPTGAPTGPVLFSGKLIPTDF